VGAFFEEFEDESGLFDCYFGTTDSLAGKSANFANLVRYNTVTLGVKGVVTADHSAFASTLIEANLANDHLTGLNFLAAINLNTKTLSWTIASIFGGTAGFYV
jgi:hypothetical protein